jgi:pimeloyl-ACP methyl ester carboxylesterase
MTDLHIDTLGAGADVVLLHGLPQHPFDFARLVGDLAGSHRTHVVHLPGYGESVAVVGAYDLDAVAERVAGALRERGIESAVYVGSSAGFYRAIQLARSERAPTARMLIGFGPFAGLDDEGRATFRGAADAVLAGADLSQLLIDRFLSPRFAEANPDARRHAAGMAQAASNETIAAELRAFADAPGMLDALGQLEIPVRVRTGELDIPAPPDVVRTIAKAARDGHREVVAEAGHLLLLEDYEGTLAWTRAALADLG